jgi:broad specificity phosphatase PhoE|uniref:Phosphoglycerate mutase n=1 Tax=Panagrolaimus davidi TaxID=227884 RepID=A0A914QSX0_9BILA
MTNLKNITKNAVKVSKSTRNLWVVRHGERVDKIDPNWHKTAPRGAWDDPPITDKGIQQAKEVGKRLQDEQIDYIFCSPFVRCLQTATAIVGELKTNAKLKLFVEPGFCETFCVTQFPPGCLTAKELVSNYELIDPEYEHFLKEFLPEDDEYVCERRIRKTIESILEKYTGNILIISHGSPIAAIHTVLGRKYRYVGYCGISKFVVTPTSESSPTNRENKNGPNDIHSKYHFKCSLAGDYSHLSDHTNLHTRELL